MPNFFIKKAQIENEKVKIEGDLLKHLRDSLRIRKGEKIICVDEKATRYTVVVTHVERDLLIGDIMERVMREREPAVYIHIAQALPKGPKFDVIIQKSTELGVNAITPVISERTIIRIGKEQIGEKLDRWRRIALEAAQQSSRWDIPEIFPPVVLGDFLASYRKGDINLLLWEGEKVHGIRDVLKGAGAVKNVVMLIGPEGGFSVEEVEKATAGGFIPVSLGDLILRTETAPLAALSILQYEFGGI